MIIKIDFNVAIKLGLSTSVEVSNQWRQSWAIVFVFHRDECPITPGGRAASAILLYGFTDKI